MGKESKTGIPETVSRQRIDRIWIGGGATDLNKEFSWRNNMMKVSGRGR